jgi:hypothetical protein
MILTILVVVVLHFGAFVFVSVWRRRRSGTAAPPATDAEMLAAVKAAYLAIGLPEDQFSPSFDVLRTGKTAELLHHSAAALDVNPELTTIQDHLDWLAVAPKRGVDSR